VRRRLSAVRYAASASASRCRACKGQPQCDCVSALFHELAHEFAHVHAICRNFDGNVFRAQLQCRLTLLLLAHHDTDAVHVEPAGHIWRMSVPGLAAPPPAPPRRSEALQGRVENMGIRFECGSIASRLWATFCCRRDRGGAINFTGISTHAAAHDVQCRRLHHHCGRHAPQSTCLWASRRLASCYTCSAAAPSIKARQSILGILRSVMLSVYAT